MIKFKSDDRLFIATLTWGLIMVVLGHVALKHYQVSLFTCFWLLPGLFFIAIAFLKREIVIIDDGFLIIKNRLNILPKRIRLDEIKKVKALEQENSILASNQGLLHLLLWDKKFTRPKDIKIFGANKVKLFTIDARAIDNGAYVQLIQRIRK